MLFIHFYLTQYGEWPVRYWGTSETPKEVACPFQVKEETENKSRTTTTIMTNFKAIVPSTWIQSIVNKDLSGGNHWARLASLQTRKPDSCRGRTARQILAQSRRPWKENYVLEINSHVPMIRRLMRMVCLNLPTKFPREVSLWSGVGQNSWKEKVTTWYSGIPLLPRRICDQEATARWSPFKTLTSVHF